MKTDTSPSRFDDEENTFLKLTDDEMRDQARDIHQRDWVIEIDDDAQVIRPKCLGECARIAVWIRLGPGDWSPADRERVIARGEQSLSVSRRAAMRLAHYAAIPPAPVSEPPKENHHDSN